MALDGVSWVQSGSVEIAVAQTDRVLQNRRHHLLPSLGRRSARELGSTSYLSAARLGRLELGAVSQHGVHDDGEAPCQCDPRLAAWWIVWRSPVPNLLASAAPCRASA